MPLLELIFILVGYAFILWLINTYLQPYLAPSILKIINAVSVIVVITWLLSLFGLFNVPNIPVLKVD